MSDPGMWRLAEAVAFDAKAEALEQIIGKLAEGEQLVPDAEATHLARALEARYRIWMNDWRSEAQQRRIAADELAAA